MRPGNIALPPRRMTKLTILTVVDSLNASKGQKMLHSNARLSDFLGAALTPSFAYEGFQGLSDIKVCEFLTLYHQCSTNRQSAKGQFVKKFSCENLEH